MASRTMLRLWRITQAEYDEKARALKTQQAEVATRIEQHEKGDGAFRTTLETLISVASRAADLYERSKIDQKRQLLAFVFSNLRLRGKKLEYTMRSPFQLMANQRGHTAWLAVLNTVRTQHFDEVLALRTLVPSFAMAA
jgi:site-specific DNA recombinase